MYEQTETLQIFSWSLQLHKEWLILAQVAIAMFLGGIVGWEREARDKPAGLRTHMIIAGAAALLVGLGHALLQWFVVEGEDSLIQADPIRIVEAVITGVSFLGAGTIFRRSGDDVVTGLTTAASMLLVAGIGIAVALQQFRIAVGVTALTVFVVTILRWVENRWAASDNKLAD